MQGDSFSLGEAAKEWIDLKNNPLLSNYEAEIDRRFKMAMKPYHFLAFLTTPKYIIDDKGTKLILKNH